ncbi:MAG: anion permease [Acidimicrobiales bacterium]
MIVVLIALGVGYALINGLHDAGNAIAAPIVTRALRPRSAVAISVIFHVAGALLAGRAVAATVGGVVSLDQHRLVGVALAAMCGAIVWNVFTFVLGLPCSSGHCLVGALAGAALANAGARAVHWGGMSGLRPSGVLGVLVWLILSAIVAVPVAVGVLWIARRLLRRATREIVPSIRRAEWVTTALLSFAHGSNDAQKAMGLMTLSLVATGHLSSLAVPLWVALLCACSLAFGTSLGGWRVVRTLGRLIYRISPLDGLVSQGSSAGIVLAASLLGAPVSTTDVVAPAVVGVGLGARVHHVGWGVVREIGLSWAVTLPASAVLGALALECWRIS